MRKGHELLSDWQVESAKKIAEKLEEASRSLSSRAMEMYRLNVLERLGREEGSQIVVYGMSGSDPVMDRTVAAATAGTAVSKS